MLFSESPVTEIEPPSLLISSAFHPELIKATSHFLSSLFHSSFFCAFPVMNKRPALRHEFFFGPGLITLNTGEMRKKCLYPSARRYS